MECRISKSLAIISDVTFVGPINQGLKLRTPSKQVCLNHAHPYCNLQKRECQDADYQIWNLANCECSNTAKAASAFLLLTDLGTASPTRSANHKTSYQVWAWGPETSLFGSTELAPNFWAVQPSIAKNVQCFLRHNPYGGVHVHCPVVEAFDSQELDLSNEKFAWY